MNLFQNLHENTKPTDERASRNYYQNSVNIICPVR